MWTRVRAVTEIWRFLADRKKLWLLPLMLAMLAIGGLLVFAQTSALSPLIYTLF